MKSSNADLDRWTVWRYRVICGGLSLSLLLSCGCQKVEDVISGVSESAPTKRSGDGDGTGNTSAAGATSTTLAPERSLAPPLGGAQSGTGALGEDPQAVIRAFEQTASNKIDDALLAQVASLESKRDTITIVDATNGRVTDAGLQHLASLPALRELNLSRNQISNDGLERLINIPTLEILSLKNTRLDDAAMEHLRQMQQLKELDLSGTQITDGGLASLKDLAQLEKLRINHAPRIHGSGLAPLKKGCPQLKHLEATGARLDDSAFESLRGWRQLQVLRLNGVNASNQQIQALKGCRELRVLDLGTNRDLTTEGMGALIQGLGKLEELYINDTAGSRGLSPAFVGMLAKKRYLKVLNVENTPADERLLRELRKRRPKLRIDANVEL